MGDHLDISHVVHMVVEGADQHHLTPGGPLRPPWSTIYRSTPFILGVVVISTLSMSMPHSGGPPRPLPWRPPTCLRVPIGFTSHKGDLFDYFSHSMMFTWRLRVPDMHHLAHGGPLRHLWSAATRPTPFLSGVVIVSTLQLAMPRSGVHRFTFHTVHIVFQGAWGCWLASPRTRWTTSTSLERGCSTYTLHIGCGGHFYPFVVNAALGGPPFGFPWPPHGAWGWR